MMDEKYKNKYRIRSARAAFWDYSQDGQYFITICTANRECLFGEIIRHKMILSPIGQIVLREWNKSFEIRMELFCDAYVIMPNHLHAILRIENNIVDTVETHGRASVPPYRSPKSISSFVAGFKSSATKHINQYREMPGSRVWQSRFHDHIIRNNAEYQRIRVYIENNPKNWQQDKFHII
jgi:REP element-mobilizing transposase RayT